VEERSPSFRFSLRALVVALLGVGDDALLLLRRRLGEDFRGGEIDAAAVEQLGGRGYCGLAAPR
jgi:hypothetical protein